MAIHLFEDISLHSLVSGDVADIFETIDSQRDYLGKWLPFVALTRSVDFTRSFVDSVLNAPRDSFEPTFTIRKSGKFVGLIGFKSTDKANRKTEIGYWLSGPFQGQGIATRAVKALCEYAFTELDMNRVQVKCAVGNDPSSLIPKRLGFIFEGIERAGELNSDGIFRDIEIYSILKSEYN
ncbi:MAG: GNAT family N-acetyltransferase [Rikenellaceae bacterium]|nr:GNAT family N-acetyltransferase [Rikenellaceae bacterium]MCL2693091.1 GNAT family N-acetyltransferase [Rikenellaceae bacterium]